MCDSRIGKFFASIGGDFSAPTFGKATPAYAASAALSALPKVRVKQISFDMWTKGQGGSERQFDEDGKEILANAAETAATASTASE